MAPATVAPHTLNNGIPYSVKLTIDHSWIKPFNDNGVRLIMAKVFKDAAGNETFNVVASAQDVTGSMSAKWEDNYQICGSTDTFQSGQVISGISGLLDIEFQQTYVLDDWSTYFIQSDTSISKTAFGFKNGVIASSVVQLNVGGEFTPVYMSPYKFPPGKATLRPLPKVVFWFQADLESSTMITMDVSNSIMVDLSQSTSAGLSYDAKGIWQQVPVS